MAVPVATPGSTWNEYLALRKNDAFGADDLSIALAIETLSLGAFGFPELNGPAYPTLSPRENAVASHLAAGRTRAAIAHALGISVRTMDKHLEHIYEKLNVHDRLAAAQAFLKVAGRSPAPTRHALDKPDYRN